MTQAPRVLILHNRYKLHGGEDACVDAQQRLLESRGHRVSLVVANNEEINTTFDSIRTAAAVVYSWKWKRQVAAEIEAFCPDIVHVHNNFPLMSPSIFYAAADARVPVVQTLHNYRLTCTNGLLYRDGQVCERCLGRAFPWEGVKRGCYRDSVAGTFAVGISSALHHWAGTYDNVSAFIVLSQFSRDKFIEIGLPSDKLSVIPNFLDIDPGPGIGDGGYFLYVGRLSEEKGVRTLLRAWSKLDNGPELRIIGKGPLEREVVAETAANQNIRWLGFQEPGQVLAAMRGAIAVVVPSVCYEGCPLAVLEAFAAGTPVIASDLGSLTSVPHGIAGLRFEAGNAEALVTVVEKLLAIDTKPMRAAARAEFERNYTADAAYAKLSALYEALIRDRMTGRLG